MKKIIPLFFCLLMLSARLGSAATYTWANVQASGSDNWSTASEWIGSTGTTGIIPTTADTAFLLDTGGTNRIVFYDATASGALGTLNITQTSNGTNTLVITPTSGGGKTLTISNAIALGASGGGVAELRLISNGANGANLVDYAGLTINSGGLLTLSPGAGPTTYTPATFSGPVTLNSGGQILVVCGTTTGSVSHTISGAFTMNGGQIVITGSSTTDVRLTIGGNADLESGTISQMGSSTLGQLCLTGGTNVIGNSVIFLGKTEVTLNGGASQTLVTSSTLPTLALRYDGGAGLGVRTVTSNVAGVNIGSIYFYSNAGTANQSVELKLGSDLTSAVGVGGPTASGGGVNKEKMIIDLAGHTLNLIPASTTAWALTNQGGNGTWSLQSTSGTTGRIQASGFNFSTVTADVGPNVILEASGVNTSYLTGTAGNPGIIDATSTFVYLGGTTAGLASTNRSIGNLVVGMGTDVPKLFLASDITTGTNSQVTVNAGATLNLAAYSLYLTPNPATTINLARGGTITNSGTGGIYLNSAVGINVTGTSGMATISSGIYLSGTNTFGGTAASGTDLLLSGKIADGASAGSIVAGGTNVIAITGTNTYTGGLTVQSGTVYLANQAAGKGALSVTGTGGGNAFVQLTANLGGLTSVTLSGTTGASGILDTKDSTVTPTSSPVTVNAGGILQTTGTGYGSIVSGSVVVNSGGILRTVNTTTTVENKIIGDLTLNSGALLTTSTGGTQAGGGRIAVGGNFTANAGSTINTNGNGYLALYGGTNVIGSNVTITTPTGGAINTIGIVGTSGTQTLQSGVNLGALYVRDNGIGDGAATKTLQLTGTATTITNIMLANGDTSALTLRLGSNVISTSGLNDIGFVSTGRLIFDLNGYTFTESGVAWTPAGSGTTATSPWTISSTGGTGTFRATSFNLTGNATDVTIAANVVMEATSAGATTDLGLRTGGTGTIDAASTFLFGTTGTHSLKSSLGRTIGNVQVGNGVSLSTLALAGNITTGSNSSVSVKNGSTLDLGLYSLATSGVIQLDGGKIAGTTGSQLNMAGGITATGSNSTISAPIVLSGTGYQDISVADASTTLGISGNITGSTGTFRKTGDGLLTLSGNASYSGSTSVVGGELDVNGSLTASSAVAVGSGATLGGSGHVTGDVNVTNGTMKGSGLNVSGNTTFNGTSTLAGTVTSASGITVASGGALNVTGTTSSNVSVQNSTLNGTGSTGAVALVGGTLNGTLSTGAISGTGLVSPGNSPGILTATSLTVGAGLNFAFELTLAAPTYNSATASGNDILHLIGGTPFSGNLTSDNTISVYLASATVGSTYLGGIFADQLSAVLLKGAVENAKFVYYVLDTDTDYTGDVIFNSNYYTALDSSLSVTVTAESVSGANFSTGAASGSELEFTVVPEPSTWAMLVGGLGMLAAFRRGRKNL